MKHLVFLLLLIGALSAWTQIQRGAEKDAAAEVTPITITKVLPTNLDDCFTEIDRLFDDSQKESARSQTEAEFVSEQLADLGSWMSEHWDLDGANLLTKYFQGLGVERSNDMASVILHGYYRHLRQSPVAINELVQGYQ